LVIAKFQNFEIVIFTEKQKDMYKQCEFDALTFNKIESVRQSLSPRQQYTVPPFALCIIPAERSTVPHITATNSSIMGST
jgi:hypothetical protein